MTTYKIIKADDTDLSLFTGIKTPPPAPLKPGAGYQAFVAEMGKHKINGKFPKTHYSGDRFYTANWYFPDVKVKGYGATPNVSVVLGYDTMKKSYTFYIDVDDRVGLKKTESKSLNVALKQIQNWLEKNII